MPARLNRRRYREIVATLKEVIADPKATRPQRLRAVETLLGVYDRHDRNEERKAAHKRALENAQTTEETAEEAPETLDALLERMRTERDEVVEQEEI